MHIGGADWPAAVALDPDLECRPGTPAPASLRGTRLPRGGQPAVPCGAGAGSGCVAWHTRGRVEAAAVSVCVSVTRPPPSM